MLASVPPSLPLLRLANGLVVRDGQVVRLSWLTPSAPDAKRFSCALFPGLGVAAASPLAPDAQRISCSLLPGFHVVVNSIGSGFRTDALSFAGGVRVAIVDPIGPGRQID